MELWGANAKFGWSDGMEGEMVMVLKFKVGLGDLGDLLGRASGCLCSKHLASWWARDLAGKAQQRDEAADNLFKRLLNSGLDVIVEAIIFYFFKDIYSFCAQL
jgi:hypothetical protein